jgi:hypothetical protein
VQHGSRRWEAFQLSTSHNENKESAIGIMNEELAEIKKQIALLIEYLEKFEVCGFTQTGGMRVHQEARDRMKKIVAELKATVV